MWTMTTSCTKTQRWTVFGGKGRLYKYVILICGIPRGEEMSIVQYRSGQTNMQTSSFLVVTRLKHEVSQVLQKLHRTGSLLLTVHWLLLQRYTGLWLGRLVSARLRWGCVAGESPSYDICQLWVTVSLSLLICVRSHLSSKSQPPSHMLSTVFHDMQSTVWYEQRCSRFSPPEPMDSCVLLWVGRGAKQRCVCASSRSAAVVAYEAAWTELIGHMLPCLFGF